MNEKHRTQLVPVPTYEENPILSSLRMLETAGYGEMTIAQILEAAQTDVVSEQPMHTYFVRAMDIVLEGVDLRLYTMSQVVWELMYGERLIRRIRGHAEAKPWAAELVAHLLGGLCNFAVDDPRMCQWLPHILQRVWPEKVWLHLPDSFYTTDQDQISLTSKNHKALRDHGLRYLSAIAIFVQLYGSEGFASLQDLGKDFPAKLTLNINAHADRVQETDPEAATVIRQLFPLPVSEA